MVDINSLDYIEIHRKLAAHFLPGPGGKGEDIYLSKGGILLYINDAVFGSGLSSTEVLDVFQILLDIGIIKKDEFGSLYCYNHNFNQ